MKVKQLKEKRGALVKRANEILDVATRERRSLTGNEEMRFDEMKREIFQLDQQIVQAEHEDRLAMLNTRSAAAAMEFAGYSLCRAITRAGQGCLDGFEAEVSQEIAQRSGLSPSGFYAPYSALVEQRAMSVTGGTTSQYGGDLVATELRGFIDALRPMMAVGRAGATILDGLTSNVAIPRQSAASTASWKAETAALDEATPTIDQLELSPKRCGAYTVLSKQLLIQSTPDVERIVRNDLLSACAIALDAAAINGAGGTAPTGILNTNGIGSVVGGTNGAAMDWRDIVDLVAAIEDADALAGRLAFLINPRTAAKLRSTVKVSSTDSRMLLEGGSLLDYPTYISTQVPSNLTKGSASGVCSAVIFGDFSGVILASFGQGVDLVVDPFTNAVNGQTRVIANSFVDVGIRRAEMFAARKDVLTA
jgi:HK97 family phage major capsid protein